jgi:DNA modification methylase
VIRHGDCLDVMAAMDTESIDAIVTDPPYGLEFMGKEWDKFRTDDPGTRRNRGERAAAPTITKAEPERGNPWASEASGYRGGERPSTSRCTGCGKRDQRRNPHECTPGAAWKSELIDPYSAPPSMLALQNWTHQWAQAAYRVAKPSAYLLAFGGTRTVHRMTVALEDAGWIIRDMLVWGYASGFPKSKASLKPAWEPIVMARKPGPLRMLAIDECRMPIADDEPNVRTTPTMGPPGMFGVSGHNGQNLVGRWPANIVLTDPIFDGGIEGVVGGGETGRMGDPTDVRGLGGIWHDGNGVPAGPQYGDTGTYSRFFTIPEGGTMCEWCGASPAEASSRQRNGPGVSVADPAPTEASSAVTTPTDSPTTSATEQTSWHDGSGTTSRNEPSPASRLVVPSRSVRARSAARPRTSSGITMITESRWMCDSCADAATRFSMAERESAERNYPWAFLIPKAARSDREPVLGGLAVVDDDIDGSFGLDAARPHTKPDYQYQRKARANVHPTVKPTDLMRHLVRLVTPAGGTVLDPFLGSGTTGLAAEMEGFAWVGIEREAEYVAIAEARLNGTQRGLGI